jgi:serine/threonine protein kinase
MGIEINKVTDLCSICQDDRGKGPNGERVPRTAFAAVDKEENAFFGEKSGISMRDLTVDDIRECLRPLPDEEIYPLLPEDENITVAPDDVAGFYVKRTAWSTYLDFRGTEFLPKLMLKETRTMELLTRHPHPNIVRYYGARVKRGRITGLVLETFPFPHDLGFVKTRPDLFKGSLDKERILSGLRSALDHLHSLGLAHNDINPANIMLGDGGAPKLIDFGSCEPFGGHLMSAGTPGWSREGLQGATSDKANDEYSLELLGPWLETVVKEVEDSLSTSADWRLDVKDIPPLEVQKQNGTDGQSAGEGIHV